jgi:hypothetical protein
LRGSQTDQNRNCFGKDACCKEQRLALASVMRQAITLHNSLLIWQKSIFAVLVDICSIILGSGPVIIGANNISSRKPDCVFHLVIEMGIEVFDRRYQLAGSGKSKGIVITTALVRLGRLCQSAFHVRYIAHRIDDVLYE